MWCERRERWEAARMEDGNADVLDPPRLILRPFIQRGVHANRRVLGSVGRAHIDHEASLYIHVMHSTALLAPSSVRVMESVLRDDDAVEGDACILVIPAIDLHEEQAHAQYRVWRQRGEAPLCERAPAELASAAKDAAVAAAQRRDRRRGRRLPSARGVREARGVHL